MYFLQCLEQSRKEMHEWKREICVSLKEMGRRNFGLGSLDGATPLSMRGYDDELKRFGSRETEDRTSAP